MTMMSTTGTHWRRHLWIAAGCAGLGLVVHLLGALIPVQVAVVGLGVGVIGAACLLADLEQGSLQAGIRFDLDIGDGETGAAGESIGNRAGDGG